MSKKKLYIAGPLFSQAELDFNAMLKKKLLPYFDVYLPQEDGELVAKMMANGDSTYNSYKTVFDGDIYAIKRCEIFLIVLDGRTVDEGAAFELGYAHAIGKRCLGIKTDSRHLLKTGDNPMVDQALQGRFKNIYEAVCWGARERDGDV